MIIAQCEIDKILCVIHFNCLLVCHWGCKVIHELGPRKVSMLTRLLSFCAANFHFTSTFTSALNRKKQRWWYNGLALLYCSSDWGKHLCTETLKYYLTYWLDGLHFLVIILELEMTVHKYNHMIGTVSKFSLVVSSWISDVSVNLVSSSVCRDCRWVRIISIDPSIASFLADLRDLDQVLAWMPRRALMSSFDSIQAPVEPTTRGRVIPKLSYLVHKWSIAKIFRFLLGETRVNDDV